MNAAFVGYNFEQNSKNIKENKNNNDLVNHKQILLNVPFATSYNNFNDYKQNEQITFGNNYQFNNFGIKRLNQKNKGMTINNTNNANKIDIENLVQRNDNIGLIGGNYVNIVDTKYNINSNKVLPNNKANLKAFPPHIISNESKMRKYSCINNIYGLNQNKISKQNKKYDTKTNNNNNINMNNINKINNNNYNNNNNAINNNNLKINNLNYNILSNNFNNNAINNNNLNFNNLNYNKNNI